MKRLNYLLGFILSLPLLLACNKDESYENGENSGGLHAAFSIKMGGVNTYATKTGQAEENTLASVHVYLFDDMGLVSSGGIIMNGTTGATTLETTLGAKTVYALINATSNMNVPIFEKGTTVDEFRAGLKQTEILNDDKIANLGKFLMFGVAKATITKEENKTEALAKSNPIVISVNRATAKVSFVYGNAVVVDGLKGSVNDVKFTLNQTHKTLDLVREVRVGEITSSSEEINYTATEPTTHIPGTDAMLGTYTHLNRVQDAINDTHYKLASLTFDEASKFANSHYCLENINETPVTGNSTFVIVKLKFTPKDNKISEGGDFSEYATTTTLDAGGDFWVVTSDKLKFLFADESEANAIIEVDAIFAGGTVQKYTGGYCYYRLNLRDQTFQAEIAAEMTKRYAVLRNFVYKINIQRISMVGEENPEDLIPIDPTTPLEKEAFMTANIEIIDWTVVEMNEDLN